MRPGFSDFVSQFSDKERKKRMGQRCPLIPNLAGIRDEPSSSPTDTFRRILRSMAHWLCKGFLRQWIYKKCQLEKSSGDGPTRSLETNAQLYPRLGDYGVLKPAPTDKDALAVEVVTAGLFGDFWPPAKK